jgi:hypothetical protein
MSFVIKILISLDYSRIEVATDAVGSHALAEAKE